jgi:RNA polymerase sigma-70 factor (ECF subfamily)
VDESRLIQDARRGDLDAFNRLVLAYQDMVYNQAYRMMGEVQAAEDATQEAFISAYQNLHSYRGGSFRGWLLRIVTNACYDELRRRQRRPTTPLEPLTSDDEEMDSPSWSADPGELPEETVLRGELGTAIQRCLDELPDEFRVMVVLVDVQGLNYQEAADIIRKPVGTVKSRLSRARVRLRQCLQGVWELLPAAYRLVDEGLS